MDRTIIYLIMHLFGNFMIILALGGCLVWSINQGNRIHAWKKQLGIYHGVGLVLSLIGGFGLLARLQIPFPFPLWVWGKFGIWFLFAGLLPLIVRKQEKAKAFWYLTIILVLIAILLVELKI